MLFKHVNHVILLHRLDWKLIKQFIVDRPRPTSIKYKVERDKRYLPYIK